MEMNLPINQEVQDNQSIADKYREGPPLVPEVSNIVPENQQMSKETAMQFLNDVLPLMRLQAEYDKLMIEQLTNDGLLNRRPINEIPGLLGLEMKVRELKGLGYIGQVKAEIENQQQAQKEMEQKMQEQPQIREFTEYLEYIVDEAGKVQAFIQGKPLADAPEILSSDPTGRICWSIPTTTGQREICVVPGNCIGKDMNGEYWKLTDAEVKHYNK